MEAVTANGSTPTGPAATNGLSDASQGRGRGGREGGRGGQGGGRGNRGERGQGGNQRGRRQPSGRGGMQSGQRSQGQAGQFAPRQIPNENVTNQAQPGQEKDTAAQNGAEEDDESEVCFICAGPVVHNAVAPCNHRTCHICSLRMRALYKNRACMHCRVRRRTCIFLECFANISTDKRRHSSIHR
jgi:hypothetical protein